MINILLRMKFKPIRHIQCGHPFFLVTIFQRCNLSLSAFILKLTRLKMIKKDIRFQRSSVGIRKTVEHWNQKTRLAISHSNSLLNKIH